MGGPLIVSRSARRWGSSLMILHCARASCRCRSRRADGVLALPRLGSLLYLLLPTPAALTALGSRFVAASRHTQRVASTGRLLRDSTMPAVPERQRRWRGPRWALKSEEPSPQRSQETCCLRTYPHPSGSIAGKSACQAPARAVKPCAAVQPRAAHSPSQASTVTTVPYHIEAAEKERAAAVFLQQQSSTAIFLQR